MESSSLLLKEYLSNHGQQKDSTFLYQLHFCFSCIKWTVNKALVLLGKFFNSKFNTKDVIMAHMVF